MHANPIVDDGIHTGRQMWSDFVPKESERTTRRLKVYQSGTGDEDNGLSAASTRNILMGQ
jgi:hypothetical protein